MQQSRLGSLYEAGFNIIIGFGVSFGANWLVLPLFGFNVSVSQNFAIGGIYTLISLARSYVIRRWFNARLHRAALALANN
jgi:uncharacterized membrane protein (DUF485 family)